MIGAAVCSRHNRLLPLLFRARGAQLFNKFNSSSSNAGGNATKSKITPRDVNYSEWYNDVIKEADLVDSSPTRGCLIIKPWAMSIWDRLRDNLDKQIKMHGCENAYFPLLIPQSFFTKEAEHIKGFAKECAVVTHSRLTTSVKDNNTVTLVPDPLSKLEESLIVRPTSETVIWNSFGKWISSYRDLPLKLNQWCNVLRWEMRTRPFLRTSEFLWQEGHTAHASKECALSTTKHMLQVYTDVCEEVLALPVVQGVKSPMERFAGADDTFTIEGLMQNGWALQCGTSHFLGQNFGKAFNVNYQTDKSTMLASAATTEGEDSISGGSDREVVWGTSFGVSTRLIGAMIMAHSDDKGLVCPPAVAPVQVVLVPLYVFNKDSSLEGLETTSRVNAQIDAYIKQITSHMDHYAIRYKIDHSDARPGVKYYKWERKGVPVRISIGARECVSDTLDCAIRYDGSVVKLPSDAFKQATATFESVMSNSLKLSPFTELLNQIHSGMYEQAAQRMVDRTYYVSSYAELKDMLAAQQGTGDNDINNIGGKRRKEKAKGKKEKGEREGSAAAVNTTPTSTTVTITDTDTDTDVNVDAEHNADASSYGSQTAGFYLAPWACSEQNEVCIKEELKLTIRCYPLYLNKHSSGTSSTSSVCTGSNDLGLSQSQVRLLPSIPPLTADTKCFYSGNVATHIAMFARAY